MLIHIHKRLTEDPCATDTETIAYVQTAFHAASRLAFCVAGLPCVCVCVCVHSEMLASGVARFVTNVCS